APEGTQILTGSDDGTARLWDLDTAEQLGWYAGSAIGIETARFSPGSTTLLTNAGKWDISTGVEQHFALGGKWVSSDGARVIVANMPNETILYDTITGQEIHHLEGHKELVY